MSVCVCVCVCVSVETAQILQRHDELEQLTDRVSFLPITSL